MQTRLLLISHAATAAMRSGRFPADEPLDARGVADAAASRKCLPVTRDALALSSPAACARDTAQALGFTAEIVSRLADVDRGRWCGRRLADVAAEEPHALAAWSREPDAAPHGGESFAAVLVRVGAWLDELREAGDVVAVTHAAVTSAAVIRALGVSPASSRIVHAY